MSTHSTDEKQIARRYATAMFALAVEAKSEQAATDEVSALAAAISGNAALADALDNPMVTHQQKADILAALMADASPLVRQSVAVIANAGRSRIIPAIAALLREALTAQRGEMAAVVTSARALPAATQKQLQQSLAKATGKKVTLQMKEDARVLGGLKIELGSLLLDATLSGALNQMREQLLAPTH